MITMNKTNHLQSLRADKTRKTIWVSPHALTVVLFFISFTTIQPFVFNSHQRINRPTSSQLHSAKNEVKDHERRKSLKNLTILSNAFIMNCLLSTTTSKPVQAAKELPKSIPEEYRQGTYALGGTDENAPIPKEAYKKLPSGVIYADIRPGNKNGDAVTSGSRVNMQWVLRKSNGYFVDSSEVQDGVPFIFTVGDKNGAIAGVDEGVRGMKVGGARRILIPPSLAYVDGLDDGKPGPMPAGYGPRQQMRRVQSVRKDVPGEYIYLEVQVTRVR